MEEGGETLIIRPNEAEREGDMYREDTRVTAVTMGHRGVTAVTMGHRGVTDESQQSRWGTEESKQSRWGTED